MTLNQSLQCTKLGRRGLDAKMSARTWQEWERVCACGFEREKVRVSVCLSERESVEIELRYIQMVSDRTHNHSQWENVNCSEPTVFRVIPTYLFKASSVFCKNGSLRVQWIHYFGYTWKFWCNYCLLKKIMGMGRQKALVGCTLPTSGLTSHGMSENIDLLYLPNFSYRAC